MAPFDALLSAGERARAARFRLPELTRRYTAAHGRLRQLLAAALGLAPQELEFTAGPHGKPALAGAAAVRGLQFNLSHSGGWGLAGWAWNRAIGVDVELMRPMRDEAALVRRYFSPAEIAAYEALPPMRREQGFFNAWTRKEAYVKAVGRGLALSLASFDVSLNDGEDACLLRPSAEVIGEGDNSWSLAAPEITERAAVAVVLQAPGLKLTPVAPMSR